MTSLSQYPAEETPTQEVVVHVATSVSLKVATLFMHLEEVGHRGPRDMALLVPMTLPTSCRDVSLGMAVKAAGRDMENVDLHLPGGTQPTFLVASRDGYAQRNPETGVPVGHTNSVLDLVHDRTTDATLMTPACRMFSKMAKTCNLRSRPLLPQDMDGLKGAIERKCMEAGTFRGIQLDKNPTTGALQAFVELLFMMQRLVDNGATMQETYEMISERNPEATSRFKSMEACRQLNLRLAECDNDDDVKEQCHWLAVSLLLQHVSPIFVSPVAAAHKAMSAVLSNSGLSTRYDIGDFPFLYMKGSMGNNQPSLSRPKVNATNARLLKLTTSVFAPVDASAKSLDSAVRYLYQKSLEAAENVETTDGQFENTHR